MDSRTFIRQQLRELQSLYDQAVADLDDGQLNWRPEMPAGLSPAFSLWHYVRTVDNVVRFVLQRRPTVWMGEGWDQRFGLDSKAQGTGWSHEQAAALRIAPAGDWRRYQSQVWQATEEYLSGLTEEELGRVVKVVPLGELPVERVLLEVCLIHGNRHLGEVACLRGQMGLPSITI